VIYFISLWPAAKRKQRKITLTELGSMLEHVVKSVANIEEKADAPEGALQHESQNSARL
jgi:hypothetical protein